MLKVRIRHVRVLKPGLAYNSKGYAVHFIGRVKGFTTVLSKILHPFLKVSDCDTVHATNVIGGKGVSRPLSHFLHVAVCVGAGKHDFSTYNAFKRPIDLHRLVGGKILQNSARQIRICHDVSSLASDR
jgi:hypothetical protein